MEGRLPNLLIIGAMKCGTTSLHDYLNRHPDIFMSEPKEIHYYADENYNSKDVGWYKDFFKSDSKIVGTTPQSYTKAHNKYYKNIPERIHKDTPDVKMIYIVRDPIKRYASHILESYHCDPIHDIEYSKESGNFWKTSLYYYQISHYLKYFKKEQIHVLSLEELNENPLNELNKIFKFLEVEEVENKSLFDFVSNSAETKKIPKRIKNNILYRAGLKLNANATAKVGELLAKRFYKKLLSKPTLTNEDLDFLKEKLQDDVTKFRELTGKPFGKWSI